ncbi:hypothetical protein GE061_002206 [Apolygus lucorum]|uniref:Uncharacterized protein n=1 Tax=Apolygus lucorum TaxID=248454 RepID=A0A8S9X6A1_APOLU|nr:hypothetical protein GE061_002206 [Apolygus lucorum]
MVSVEFRLGFVKDRSVLPLQLSKTCLMCPLWPLHIVLMYLIALCPLWFVACQIASKAATWGVQFSSSELDSLFMYQKQQVDVSVDQFTQDDLDNRVIRALVNNPDIASVSPSELVFRKEPGGLWSSAFNVSGDFLGYTSIKLCMSEKQDATQSCVKESKPIDVTVKRKPAIIDKIFTYSVIILVSIIFINFGCALDVNSLKQAIIKPVGPVIGLVSHFLFLPLYCKDKAKDTVEYRPVPDELVEKIELL